MTQPNLGKFIADYVTSPVEERLLADITVTGHEATGAPFIIIRHGERVLVLNLMAFDASEVGEAHLVLDAHGFIDGEPANIGYFGMTPGKRHSIEDPSLPTSQGFPATGLATLLLGAQRDPR